MWVCGGEVVGSRGDVVVVVAQSFVYGRGSKGFEGLEKGGVSSCFVWGGREGTVGDKSDKK